MASPAHKYALAVIGAPDVVADSLSPAIWNQAFEELGYSACHYDALPLGSEQEVRRMLDVNSAVRSKQIPGRDLHIQQSGGIDNISSATRGLYALNVTMPYKEFVAGYLPKESLSARAALCGSVNTVCFRQTVCSRGMGNTNREVVADSTDGAAVVEVVADSTDGAAVVEVVADSTDGAAVVEALSEAGVDLSGAEVTMVGAGGSARSAAFALADAGVASLRIYNRSLEPAEKLAADLHKFFSDLHIEVAGKMPIPVTAHVLISAVPGSFWSNSQDHLQRLHVSRACVDLAYDARLAQATELMKTVRAQRAIGIDGREILARQAALAFAFVFGVEPPTEVMLRAAR